MITLLLATSWARVSSRRPHGNILYGMIVTPLAQTPSCLVWAAQPPPSWAGAGREEAGEGGSALADAYIDCTHSSLLLTLVACCGRVVPVTTSC